ncbi:hypothetical protein ATE59_01020 [Sphingopyxis sp. A083]|nr:hypothetical protein ATE59_01020 [Sphingopyxis sp. A083]
MASEAPEAFSAVNRLLRDVRVRTFVAACRAVLAIGDDLPSLIDMRLEILCAARLAFAAGIET